MFNIRGRIINKRTETIQSKSGEEFERMFITIIETDTGFDHKHQFEIFGKESIAVHKDNIKEDRYVKIEFYIKSNEWKDKFFNTLNIKNIILEDKLDIPNLNDDIPFGD